MNVRLDTQIDFMSEHTEQLHYTTSKSTDFRPDLTRRERLTEHVRNAYHRGKRIAEDIRNTRQHLREGRWDISIMPHTEAAPPFHDVSYHWFQLPTTGLGAGDSNQVESYPEA